MAESELSQLRRVVGLAQDKSVPLPPPLMDQVLHLAPVAAPSEEQRFLSALAALMLNIEADSSDAPADIPELLALIDECVDAQLNEVLHHPIFQAMEANWRGLYDLVSHTNFKADIGISLLDVGKEELAEDLESNALALSNGALFKKVYIREYDQYGGRPYGSLIGLYEFEHTPRDLQFLDLMGQVANASHAPFISAASHAFFKDSVEEVANLTDLRGHLERPAYNDWEVLRNKEHAAYLGLTFPRYILRKPWHPRTNPAEAVRFTEDFLSPDPKEDKLVADRSRYLWGNSAILFARNLVRSFELTGWCQNIRGPKGGGKIDDLPAHSFELRGQDELMMPVEIMIPDFRELDFAQLGFIPLVYRKDSAEATFFSTQSIKKAKKFKDPKDSENSQLVTNLAYTYSIIRIAHYVKCIMRDNIGSTADGGYVQTVITNWLYRYITTVVNPDDITVARYPFKAASVQVTPRPGEIGWYDCVISVLPHIQFEGISVELRLESRLG